MRPGWFVQTHEHPELVGRTLLEILHRGDAHRDGMPREQASRVLDRYELAHAAEQRFESLSGGQQARFQILLLELSGATLLLLDEPTDNLDVESAEALEEGLEAFEGTVLAVTHDRWFARGFDRFLVFGADGSVYESDDPVWDEGRVSARPLRASCLGATAAGSRGCAGRSRPRSRRCSELASRPPRRCRRRRRPGDVPLRRDGQLGPGGERVRCHAAEEPRRAVPMTTSRRAVVHGPVVRCRRASDPCSTSTGSCGRAAGTGTRPTGPLEPGLAERLTVETVRHGRGGACAAARSWWRSRAGSGPADQAPVVLRGTALRDAAILRVLAVERGIRGVLLVLLAYGVYAVQRRRATRCARCSTSTSRCCARSPTGSASTWSPRGRCG